MRPLPHGNCWVAYSHSHSFFCGPIGHKESPWLFWPWREEGPIRTKKLLNVWMEKAQLKRESLMGIEPKRGLSPEELQPCPLQFNPAQCQPHPRPNPHLCHQHHQPPTIIKISMTTAIESGWIHIENLMRRWQPGLEARSIINWQPVNIMTGLQKNIAPEVLV